MDAPKANQPVITGMGVVSPLGPTLASTWANMKAGGLSARPVLVGPAARRRWHLACPIHDDVEAEIDPANDRTYQLASLSAAEALGQALLTSGKEPDLARLGVCVGTSKPPLPTFMAMQESQDLRAVEALDASTLADQWAWFFGGSLASQLASQFGAGGPVSAPVAACATGLVAVIEAAQWIADGRCDLVLAGGADASLNELVLNSYRRSGAVVTIDADLDLQADRRPSHADALRPFCQDRQGFVIGEGAGLLVIESAQSAERRGVPILAQLAGWALASDASTLTSPPDTTEVLQHLVQQTFDQAGLEPNQIGFINTHGTGTYAGDRWEALGLRKILESAHAQIPAVAHKSQLGHLLGAAGAVETVLSVQSLLEKTVLPTPTYQNPDPELMRKSRLALSSKSQELDHRNSVLKLSFGFGGHLAALILKGRD